MGFHFKKYFESIQFYIFCTFKCFCDSESSHHSSLFHYIFTNNGPK